MKPPLIGKSSFSRVLTSMGGKARYIFGPLLLGGLLLTAIPTQAATYYVSPSGNDTNNGTSLALARQTIQAAINIAKSGDIVLVNNGTYGPITISQGVTVRSVNGAQATIINGGGIKRCVYLNRGAVLDGFTVINGYNSSSGGGISAYYGTVENCVISDNSAYYYSSYNGNGYTNRSYSGNGGGIYAQYSTVRNCTISGNTAPSGGGIYTYHGTVENCAISDNSAYYYSSYNGNGYSNNSYSGSGGGIAAYNSILRDCIISGNTSPNGGGIYTYYGTVENCAISDNSAYYCSSYYNNNGYTSRSYSGYGGGISAYYNTMRDCTVSENMAGNYGGGVRFYQGTAQNCTVSGNTAGNYGGGVYACNGTVQNCTISGNAVSNCGGGMYFYQGTAQNCTVSGNIAGSYGGGTYFYKGMVQNCAISGNTAGFYGGGAYVSYSALQNCTISGNAVSNYGGGVHSCNGTMQGCIISGNTANNFGGGVYASYSMLQDCTISTNSAGRLGGGIFCDNSTSENCTVVGNVVNQDGGGVYLFSRTTVKNCALHQNIAYLNGGGAYVQNGIVENCTINGNTSYGSAPTYGYDCGGGVFVLANGTVRNCAITENIAYWDGGGAFLWGGKLENCTVSKNDARSFGGGVCIVGGNAKNCLISGNRADDTGGGLHSEGGAVENCTIVGNTIFSDNGGRGRGGGAYILAGTVRNCIVYYNQDTDVIGAISHSCMGTNIAGTGNIKSKPQFVSLGTGYGTNHVPGDYRLQAISPCINTGTNQSWMTSVTDLDGLPRLSGSVVDMGAYEWRGSIIMRNPAILSNQCDYGSNAPGQTIEVWNGGIGVMTYVLSPNANWLSLSPANGTGAGEIDQVTINYQSAGLMPGTYTGIVTVTSAEAANSPQTVAVYLSVKKADQAITFPAIPTQVVTSQVGLAATASSGLPVSFTVVSGPGVITDGTKLTFTSAGTVLVVASQTGNKIYNPAPNVTNTVAVSRINQTITFPAIPGQTVTSQVTLVATASSGLPVSFTVLSGPGVITYGTKLTFTSAGVVQVVAIQAGNTIYNPAPNVTQTVAVGRTGQTITFPAIPGQTVTSQVTLVATASSGLPVSFTVVSGPGTITGGIKLTFTSAGTVLVAASQEGNASYYPAPSVTNTVIVINPPAGEIRFAETNLVVNEDTGNVELRIIRTNGNYGVISVEYTNQEVTASAGSDYGVVTGQLTWANEDASDKVITIPVIDDSIDELNEIFEVKLMNVVGTSIAGTNVATVTIADNDEPGTVQFNQSSYSVNENAGMVILTVTRTGGSSGPATVEYITANGTASAGSDYTSKSGTLSWSDGDASSKTITVFITDDNLDEADETFTVTLQNAVGAGLGSPSSATVTIADNDGPLVYQADIEISDFKFEPGNLWAGDHPAMISFDLVNDGPRDIVSPDTQLLISFSLSSNTVFGDEDDIAIGTKTNDLALPAGSQTTIRYPGRAHNPEVTIPEGLTGDFYVFVNIQFKSQSGLSDPDGAHAMRNEPIRVRIQPSDDDTDIKQRGVVNDFDGDEQSDPMVYDESNGKWAILLSAYEEWVRFAFGGSEYEAVPGDYDSDCLTDPAVHQRKGSQWHIMLSGMGYQTISFDFGGKGETKGVVGDYNGDGRADSALYEERSGCWYVRLPIGVNGNMEIVSAVFGGPGYTPVVGDYDGDGRTDPALYEEETGNWQVMLSGYGYGMVSATFGGPEYKPVTGDYDGDGRIDPMLYYEKTGKWIGLMSGSGYRMTEYQCGGTGYEPVSGDYDGDGKSDIGVYNKKEFKWNFKLSKSSTEQEVFIGNE